MLVHNSIEDSLYNPHYGYLSRQATVFTSAGDPIDFRAMHDLVEFEVARRYTAYGMDEERPGRQIWHTPQNCPMYVQRLTSHLSVLLILAHRLTMERPSFNQCFASEYRLKYFPYVIYEIGAENGTLAMDLFDFIRNAYPEVHERTRYNIVEIGGRLAKLQEELLDPRPTA